MIKKLFLILKSLNTMIFKKKKDIASDDNNPPETNDDAIIDGDKILEEKKKEEEAAKEEEAKEEETIEDEPDLEDMNKTGIVTATALYVRDGPSKDYSILGCVLENDKVNIIGRNKATGWYKIEFKETFGYVSSKYVFTATISTVNNLKYGKGCEEIDEVVGSHKCCFKFNQAVLTQYAGDEVGSYGKLIYNHHCAAHNLPYGTLVYIPMLKGVVNNTGLFTVMDTGGHGMDFDIYTKKDIGKINGDVYVVSWGTGPIAWSFTQAIEYYIKTKKVERFNSAWNLYNRMNGCTINFWKYKTDDRNITSKSWYSKTNIKQP